MLAEEEIIIEYVYVGAFVKVSAVHVPTNFEVSIVGDGGLPKDCLDKVVMNKLESVMAKQA